jgi:hypothetical protein
MWLPVTMIAGPPSAIACSASAGVGSTPQSTGTSPATRIAMAQSATIAGLDALRSRPR